MKSANIDNKPLIESMLQAGVHFGYAKSRRHPSTKAHIAGTKNGYEIIDLEVTANQISKALEFVAQIAQKKNSHLSLKMQHFLLINHMLLVDGLEELLQTLKKFQNELKDTNLSLNKKQKVFLQNIQKKNDFLLIEKSKILKNDLVALQT
jgi:hypothetical protein